MNPIRDLKQIQTEILYAKTRQKLIESISKYLRYIDHSPNQLFTNLEINHLSGVTDFELEVRANQILTDIDTYLDNYALMYGNNSRAY